MFSSSQLEPRDPYSRVLRALLILALVGATVSCRDEPAPEAVAVDVNAADAEPRELAPGILRPDLRFEVAPEIGETFPDVEIHDDQGNPVRILEIAARKPHTVLTLGCLT